MANYVKDLYNSYLKDDDNYPGIIKEALGTALFFFAAETGAASPLRWGLSYLMVSEVTNCQMLSTIALRNFAKEGKYDWSSFQALLKQFVGQAFGAYFGHKFSAYYSGNAVDQVSVAGDFTWEGFRLDILPQLAMIFTFLFFLNRTAKVSEHRSLFVAFAVAVAFLVNGSGFFTPNRIFGAGAGLADHDFFADFWSLFSWIPKVFNHAWEAYLMTFIAGYVAHFFDEYFF